MQATDLAPQPEDLYTINAGGFSATADAFARDPDSCGLWFLSMVGSQTAVKAIWASLLKQPPGPGPHHQGRGRHGALGRVSTVRRPPRDRGDLDDEGHPAAGLRRLARQRTSCGRSPRTAEP